MVGTGIVGRSKSLVDRVHLHRTHFLNTKGISAVERAATSAAKKDKKFIAFGHVMSWGSLI